jgi:hypothetical protein
MALVRNLIKYLSYNLLLQSDTFYILSDFILEFSTPNLILESVRHLAMTNNTIHPINKHVNEPQT